jgi:hypothetical protein
MGCIGDYWKNNKTRINLEDSSFAHSVVPPKEHVHCPQEVGMISRSFDVLVIQLSNEVRVDHLRL